MVHHSISCDTMHTNALFYVNSITYFITKTWNPRYAKSDESEMVHIGKILPQNPLSIKCSIEGVYRLKIFRSIKLFMKGTFICYQIC